MMMHHDGQVGGVTLGDWIWTENCMYALEIILSARLTGAISPIHVQNKSKVRAARPVRPWLSGRKEKKPPRVTTDSCAVVSVAP